MEMELASAHEQLNEQKQLNEVLRLELDTFKRAASRARTTSQGNAVCTAISRFGCMIGPILWGHSGPLCYALSLLLLLLWTSIGSGVDSSDTW